MLVTSIVGEYNLITDEIRWVNAGHQPAVVRDHDGNIIRLKVSTFRSDETEDKSIYNINKMKLNGSRFYAFTDGLSESLNKEGKEIGIDGSINIIEETYKKRHQ